jgi:hypothetical protein
MIRTPPAITNNKHAAHKQMSVPEDASNQNPQTSSPAAAARVNAVIMAA